jgi:tetratricopeptide (TPR) repeat protein
VAPSVGTTVDVQLLVASTGLVFWTHHFELPEATSPVGIEQIGRQVVNAVRGAVTTRAVERSEESDASLDPADLTNRGWNDLDRRASVDDLQRGRRRFARALRSDPDSVIALLGHAGSFDMQVTEQRLPLTAEERAEYEQVVEHLLRVAPESATALRIWASMQMSRGRPELALPAIDKSIRLVPSFPNAYVLRAEALLMLGRTGEVEAEVNRAIPLAQFDTRHMSRGYALGAEAAIMLGDEERARDLAQRAVVQYPGNYRAQGALGAAEALTGHDASATIAELRKLWPQATVATYDAWRSNQPDHVKQRARFYEGLRRAGLPER